MPDQDQIIRLDAKSFQTPLETIGETLIQKLMREGDKLITAPKDVSEDIGMMVRYSVSVYRLLFYLNADVRRKSDADWSVRYGVTAMSLVRSLIDCLYNITTILQNPAKNGPSYRKSGLRKIVEDLDEDDQQYRGIAEWESYIAQRRQMVDRLIRMSGFTLDEVMKQPFWQTLGAYLGTKKTGGILTPHQEFLKTFTYLEWRQYSALSHGAYEAFAGTLGHVPVGSYFVSDFLPHETRPKVEASYDHFIFKHIGRAATVLLCIVTEIQAHARFDGHRIDERIVTVWNALMPAPEAKELYDGRYAKLMAERGISRV